MSVDVELFIKDKNILHHQSKIINRENIANLQDIISRNKKVTRRINTKKSDIPEKRTIGVESYSFGDVAADKVSRKIQRIPRYKLNVMHILNKEVQEFQGSDDLGIQAITKPKNAYYKVNRIAKDTKNTAYHLKSSAKTLNKLAKRSSKAIKDTPKNVRRTYKTIKNAYIKMYQLIKLGVKGIRSLISFLSNPMVWKGIFIVVIVVFVIILVYLLVSSIVTYFSEFSFFSTEDVLNETHVYVTELDTDLEIELATIKDNPKWKHIDEFHISSIIPNTDSYDIISYLSAVHGSYEFNDDIKSEINTLHKDLYNLQTSEWTETKEVEITVLDKNKKQVTKKVEKKINHLSITVNNKKINDFILENKDTLFKDENQIKKYNTFKKLNGTTLYVNLGNPFLNKQVYISSRYGYRIHPIRATKEFHTGIDIAAKRGTVINATMDGKVTVYYNHGYGNYLTISDGDRKTLYAHCDAILVKTGDTVKKGDKIALVGSTGISTGPHLHLEYFKKGKRCNPKFYISEKQFY